MEKSLEKKINEFVIFCLEIYKTKYNMEGKHVYKIFKDYKVIEYLEIHGYKN